jgi:hypothetical protein
LENVDLCIEGDKLIIIVDLSRELAPSKSGRSLVIASSYGNILLFGPDGKPLAGQFRLNLNLTRQWTAEEKLAGQWKPPG